MKHDGTQGSDNLLAAKDRNVLPEITLMHECDLPHYQSMRAREATFLQVAQRSALRKDDLHTGMMSYNQS